MINTLESAIANSVEARPLERRRNPRYAFIADVQILELNSGMALKARTADLSGGGCYVDTINPFPTATLVTLRLTKSDQSFEAQAKVVYSAVGMGMGLMFVAVDREQQQTLKGWLDVLGRQQLCDVDKEAMQNPGSKAEQNDWEKTQMKFIRIAAVLVFAIFGTICTHAQGTTPQQWTIVTTSESSPNAIPITTTPTGAPDPCTTGQNDNSNDSNPSCFNPLVIITDWQLSLNSSDQTVTTPNLANTFTNSSCSASGGVQSISVTGMNINDHPYKATVTVTLIDINGGVDTIVFTGKNSPDPTQFSGSFTSTGSCMNNDSGEFTAALFRAVNGTYQGSFETNGSFTSSGGGTVSITLSTDSNFNVTGNVVAANGSGLCFSNLTIATPLANTYGPSFASGDMLQAIATDSSGNVVMFTASGTNGNGLPEGNDQNGNPKLYVTYSGFAGACSGISGVDVPFSKVVPPHAPRHLPIHFAPRRRP
jgi:hypothetical protein